MTTEPTGCPFHAGGVTESTELPTDGTPLRPSSRIAQWRSEGPISSLTFVDGHQGLIATQYDAVRAVLEDPRFSLQPSRMPLSSGTTSAPHHSPTISEEAHGEHTTAVDPQLDDAASRSETAGLMVNDGDRHARLRRAVTSHFSVKRARARQPQVAETVRRQLELFRSEGSPNDVWSRYAKPIAAVTHCQVLGVPEADYDLWNELFVEGGTPQARYDYIRHLFALRTREPGDDVATDLASSDAVTREEAEGLMSMLMTSGRDSVAYLIATSTVALLTNPGQLHILQRDPQLIGPAVEELMRTGSMFLTVFARTALEDVRIGETLIPAGTSVSPSPVGANRDPARWTAPEDLDVQRDAFGHLGFGHGIHGCVGQQLARIEIREALTALITGLPGIRLEHAEQLTPLPFAHPVATYEAGHVVVAWDEGSAR